MYNNYNAEESYRQSKAIVKGVIRGAKDLKEMVLHPLDNIVYPVSELVYDATIISLHHQANNKHSSLYTVMLKKNPQLYLDSSKRMQQRIDGAKSSVKDFLSAPLESQIESLAAFGTTVLIPGGLVKGVKHFQNVRKFGTGNPSQFHSIGDTNMNYNIKTYKVDDIRKLKSIHDMIYVYTVDKELLISRSFQKTFDKTLFDPMTANKSGGFTMQILHPELARLRPVYAAGEVIVNEGKIIELTNFSGHYQPTGAHLGTTIKNAFNKAGYGEVELSTYTEFFEYGAKTIATKQRLPGRGASIAAGLFDGVRSDELNVDYPDHLREYFEEKERGMKDGQMTDRDSLIEEYSRMMNEIPVNSADAKQAYHELVLCAEQFNMDKPGANIRERLLKIAEPIHEFGILGQNLAQLAIITGGHKRTWNGVAKVAQASISIAASLTSIGSATSMLSLGAITGGIGLAIGAMGLISGLMGDNDDGMGEALQQIHQAVAAVHQAVVDMHNTMIQCFQRVEEVLVVSVVSRLNQINSKLSRLERITSQSFKELHTKDLIDITDVLMKEIVGEHSLTNGEKRSYLRQLSCWIDNHSKSSLQTQILRNGGDVSKVIEVLEETNLMESLPVFLNELTNIVPELNLANINSLPNLDILSIACDVYMVASRRPGYPNNVETIKRSQSVFSNITGLIVNLTKFNICGESLINILTRQYDTYRLWVGQFICKARGSDNWSNIETSLLSVLKEGQEKSSLLDIIDEMELRRLCLIRVGELLNVSITQLESKSDILNMSAKNYIQRGMHGIYVTENLKKSLQMGSNPHSYDSWGRPIHYITKTHSDVRNIHLLFKTHPTLPIEMSGGTQYDRGDTWGSGSSPILHAMNCGKYNMGVLFCANGLDISETDGRCGGRYSFNNTHMGNAYWWRDTGSVSSIINTRLVSLMNTPGNKLHRDQLRAAYKYYKLVESGTIPQETPFTFDSLLLLTCVISDLFPLKCYLHKVIELLPGFLNKPIEGLGITYLQFAKACKQPMVVSYLEYCGGILDTETAVNIKSLYDETITDSLPLIWQVNTSNLVTHPTSHSLTNNLANINLKIEAYLNLSVNREIKSFTNDDCLLFRDLLSEVIDTVPSNNKFIDSIKKNFNSLNKALDNDDIKSICSSLNALNSILSMTKDLASPYTLYPGINNLIADLKSMNE